VGELSAATRTRHHVIVYQVGKVASTSIVNSLKKIEGVAADQSHLLGRHSLHRMVDMLVDVRQPQYFHDHNLGQYVRNLKLTRIVEEFRARQRTGERLVLISLCREPLQWLRSAIAQDIKGHLAFFRDVAAARAIACADDDDMIARTLPVVLGELADSLDRIGGVDALLAGKQWVRAMPNTGNRPLDHRFRSFLAMSVRPSEWFEAHFEKLLDIRLGDLAPVAENLLHRDTGWCDVYVLRYEDIPASMPVIAERLGIADRFVLSSDNVSASKQFADAIRTSFRTKQAERLGTLFRASRYARTFGY
jgi:hypothetical protein